MERFKLSGLNALVIGGSGGIGKSLCEALAEAGANICPVSRTQEKLEQVAEELKRYSVNTYPYAADVTVYEEIEKMEKEVTKNFGKIDILVNAQGFNVKKPALELEKEEFDKVVLMNLNSVFFDL